MMNRKEFTQNHQLREELHTMQLNLYLHWCQISESVVEYCDIDCLTLLKFNELSNLVKRHINELNKQINEEDKIYLNKMGTWKE